MSAVTASTPHNAIDVISSELLTVRIANHTNLLMGWRTRMTCADGIE